MPQYVGYVAWRELVEENNLSKDTHKALFGYFGFCLPPQEQILGYPVAGAHNATEVGKCRYNFVWYRPADEMEIRAAADSILAPQFAEVIARTAHPLFQPIYDLESPNLVFDRVALLGDSAFGSKIIAHARHLGAYMQAQLLTGP